MDSLKAALSTALADALSDALSDAPSGGTEAPVSDVIPSDLSQSPLSALQARFMSEHATCAMCDSTLEIVHDVNREALKVKEEAHCPCCGIRVRSSHHLMH